MTKIPMKTSTRCRAKTPRPARKISAEKAVTKPYERTPQEQDAVDAMYGRKEDKKLPPRVKVSNEEGRSVFSLDCKDQELGYALLMDAAGTTNGSFLNGLLQQLGNAAAQGQQVSKDNLNFMLAVIEGIEPEDEVESMLAAQMAAIHMAMMSFACRLAHVETLPQQDSAERAFNKLARTFATQLEALKRYRTGGQQKMTVEHVHVHEGGQAIVGNVQGGGGSAKKQGPTP